MSDKPAMTPPPAPRHFKDVDDCRDAVSAVCDAVESTIRRASSFTEDDCNRRVHDEWSTVESVRHIVFVIDVWLSKTIKGEDDPFHPIGLPPHFMPAKLPGSSIDPDARPTFAEACEVLRDRVARLSAFVDQLTNEAMQREIGTHAQNVAGGLGVIVNELEAHNRFINRDLDTIEKARP